MTGTEEYTQIDSHRRSELSVHCTRRWQTSVPVVVRGGKKGNTLMLGFSAERDNEAAGTISQSCTGPAAEFFGGSGSKRIARFRVRVPTLTVTAEDGATAQLVEESSEFGIKSKILASIRIKALQPEERESRPVSGGTGQSLSDIPGPLLPDY
jgi:hypothetical protein